jgi:hypothetical protein
MNSSITLYCLTLKRQPQKTKTRAQARARAHTHTHTHGNDYQVDILVSFALIPHSSKSVYFSSHYKINIQ